MENFFTVVNWDQRGAGLSYSPHIAEDSMTLNQFVSDAHDITEYLKKKFDKSRIFVLGHSSGSMIGILLIAQYPEDYQAYIGVGQVYNMAENEIGSYDFALRTALAEAQNNPGDPTIKKAVEELQAVGRPNKSGYYARPYHKKGYMITEKWVEYFGGALLGKRNINPLYKLIFDPMYLKPDPEMYGNTPESPPVKMKDYAPLHDGYDFSELLFNDPGMRQFDLQAKLSLIQIPVYFIMGSNDYDTPVDIIRNHFSNPQFPVKKYIELKNSAHFPFYEEPQKFVQVMHEILQDNPE